MFHWMRSNIKQLDMWSRDIVKVTICVWQEGWKGFGGMNLTTFINKVLKTSLADGRGEDAF